MAKFIYSAAAILLFYAQTGFADSRLTLINHYGSALKFTVKNDTYAPLFPVHFTLEKGGEITSPVLTSPDDCNNPGFNSASIFMRADDKLNNAFVFFSAGRDCLKKKQVDISGYQDNKIAYSWHEGKHGKIVFCKPQNYPCLG